MTSRLAASRTDAAHLTASTLADLRRALHEELDAQQAHVRELQATIDELMGQSDSDSLLERQLAERARQRAVETIADIERALRRMEDGTYGTCERCGGAIAPERLAAIPFTRHCVACPPPAGG